ncbi:MAG: SDR family NAD(P)-dependent oxidoreductase [Lacisediminihabitans sp.]
MPSDKPTAVVTGASSGIGAATARELAADGFHVVLGARRVDRLEALAADISGDAMPLDVTDATSVSAFCATVDRCDVLVNNAGGAIRADSIANADLDDWRSMFEVNVLGTLSMTTELLPKLLASGDGRVVNIGSIAAREPYSGGGGYNAAKHAVSALTRVLRIEMLGQPVRVTQLDPGMVETEFSVRRFDGDEDKANAVYRGMTPLTATDIAEAVAWVVSRPRRVNIDTMLILASDQTSAQVVHRS